jgi:hypothetical protein
MYILVCEKVKLTVPVNVCSVPEGDSEVGSTRKGLERFGFVRLAVVRANSLLEIYIGHASGGKHFRTIVPNPNALTAGPFTPS